MGMKVFLLILLFLILTFDGTAFKRQKPSRCRRENEYPLSESNGHNKQNTTPEYHSNCDPTKFGIVQKIPYLRSTCDAIEIDFSTACLRCGMCLAIADKINQTLLDVHEMSPSTCFNETEVELLLRTICDHSFQYYSLREVDGTRFISDWLPGSTLVTTSADGLWPKKLKDLCHYYLNETGEIQLYKQWKQWCKDVDEFPNLSNVLCRSTDGVLRDCRSMENADKYIPRYKIYDAKIKFRASYDNCGRCNC